MNAFPGHVRGAVRQHAVRERDGVFPTHEFVQLLEGEIIITEEDGTANRFEAWDVFFVFNGNRLQLEGPLVSEEVTAPF
jgi:uncharacterized cupin superfamily protein